MSIVDQAQVEIQFIAEIGKNFIDVKEELSVEENLNKAIALVKAAKASGANAVKFQTHVLRDEILNTKFVSPHFNSADRYSWIKRNEEATPFKEFWVPLKQYCEYEKIEFFSTPMSVAAAELLQKLNVLTWKVGSGDTTDLPLLKFLCSTKKPIIISSGMVSLKELEFIVNYMNKLGSNPAILYCVSEYPCPAERLNLSTIKYFRKKFPKSIIGFSDHSIDNNSPVKWACHVGARIIEKHFSFDRTSWGSDHKASLLPNEFKEMVNQTRENIFENLLLDKTYVGIENKELEGANNKFRKYFRKGLVYSRNLTAGKKISSNDILSVRPMMMLELDAMNLEKVVGKRLNKKVCALQPVNMSDYD